MGLTPTDKDKIVPKAEAGRYRVMIVDDSMVVRGLIARALEAEKSIQVVASVGNGEMALKALNAQPVDVVLLDLEMPVMDGMTALPKLLEIDPDLRIIIASSLTLRNAEISIRALQLGAVDYISKPSTTQEMAGGRGFVDELIEKILTHAAQYQARPAKRDAGATPTTNQQPRKAPEPVEGKYGLLPMMTGRPDLIAIGSSTGGPQALLQVIKDMETPPQPVIITQHMPPSFTTILAQNISKHCGVTCVEAKDGMVCEPGVYYLAPGDYHLVVQLVRGKPHLRLNQNPPENFCRPAVDPMLRSAVAVYGGRVLVVILTGMGQDGWRGCQAVTDAGGAVIAQDEASSVVWGMPGAVVHAGLCSAILPLKDIGGEVRAIAGRVAA